MFTLMFSLLLGTYRFHLITFMYIIQAPVRKYFQFYVSPQQSQKIILTKTEQ